MGKDTLIMAALAIALLIVAYFRGGGMWLAGLQAGAKSFWGLLPILLLSFAVAGLTQVLIPRQLLMRWLGAEAGIRGIFAGCVVGALLPGPPYASYPLVMSLYQGGASLGAVVGLLSGKAVWSVHLLPPAFAVLGSQVTLAHFGANILFPPLAGLIAQSLLSRLL